jgi:hypothetical protein
MVGVIDQKTPEKIIQQTQFKICPFNRTGCIFAIEFTLPHSNQVAIKMYNLTGREIASLVNQYFDAGSYRYSWDTPAFARGCYAVRMQAGANSFMKTIQILH